MLSSQDVSWSGTGQDYGEPPGSVSGTFVISADGTITIILNNTAQCQMDAGKTIIASTSTWSDGTSMVLTFVKKTDSYTMGDLAGPWSVNALATGSVAPWWERGPAIIGLDGSFTARIEDYDGTTYNVSGSANTFTISAGGIVTIQRNGEEFRCAMNADKTVFACTGTWVSGDTGTTEMKIFSKRFPCDYTINTTSKSVKASGGSASVIVSAVGGYCAAPRISSNHGWVSDAEMTKWAEK